MERVRRPLPLSRLQDPRRRPDALRRPRPRRKTPRHARLLHRRVEARAARPLHRLDAAVAREEPPPRGRQPEVPHPAMDSKSPTSARTSSPSSGGACPKTGSNAMAPPPCSSRPSSRHPATPAPYTGRRAGSRSEPLRDADATTDTRGAPNRKRISGCGPCAETGSTSSIGKINLPITARLNGYSVSVIIRPGRDGLSLSTDRIQFDTDLYKMKADIGMLSMHRK